MYFTTIAGSGLVVTNTIKNRLFSALQYYLLAKPVKEMKLAFVLLPSISQTNFLTQALFQCQFG